jgi:hypothetical protein
LTSAEISAAENFRLHRIWDVRDGPATLQIWRFRVCQEFACHRGGSLELFDLADDAVAWPGKG